MCTILIVDTVPSAGAASITLVRGGAIAIIVRILRTSVQGLDARLARPSTSLSRGAQQMSQMQANYF